MKTLKTLLLGVTLMLSGYVSADDHDDPYAQVQEVAAITFDRIKREQPAIQQNPEILRTIMEEELLPHIDYKFSAYKVLGKHFRKVPKEKLSEFIVVFREYLITTYAVAMGYYEDQTVEFEPAQSTEGKRTVTIRAVVKEDGKPDIKIAFKVRKNKKTNEWKAYDMVAEGISLLSSKQSEFESILRQDGIQRVIDLMKDKIAKPIRLKEGAEEV